jgi:hypothetical protein
MKTDFGTGVGEILANQIRIRAATEVSIAIQARLLAHFTNENPEEYVNKWLERYRETVTAYLKDLERLEIKTDGL